MFNWARTSHALLIAFPSGSHAGSTYRVSRWSSSVGSGSAGRLRVQGA
jgi:hypothetical protein